MSVYTTKLDFTVMKSPLDKIILKDLSDYALPPINAEYLITPPGYKKQYSIPLNTTCDTIVKGQHLCLCECDCNLPDGLYTIRLHIYPYEENFIEKKYLRTVWLEKEIGRLLLKNDCEIEKATEQKYMDAFTLLQGAHAAIEECDEKTAMRFYQKSLDITTQNKTQCL